MTITKKQQTMKPKNYTLDETTIDVYLQKSTKFLYPLLKIKSTNKIQPTQCYTAWQGEIDINENKLICIYDLRKDLEYIRFETDILFKNDFFETFIEGADSKGIYIFNLSGYKEDISQFLKGRYSLLSVNAKDILKEYYSLNRFSKVYMDSFLFPENYFEKYAALLNVDEWRLRSVGELFDPPNKVKETLIMKRAVSVTLAA